MTLPEVTEVAKTWTASDLELIAFSIVVLSTAEAEDPQHDAVLAIFKRRYAELAGKPFNPAYDRLLYESDGNA
jgi:hypothetical protein